MRWSNAHFRFLIEKPTFLEVRQLSCSWLDSDSSSGQPEGLLSGEILLQNSILSGFSMSAYSNSGRFVSRFG
jgi:hypothetical protein